MSNEIAMLKREEGIGRPRNRTHSTRNGEVTDRVIPRSQEVWGQKGFMKIFFTIQGK